jgi:hypothetical protein
MQMQSFHELEKHFKKYSTQINYTKKSTKKNHICIVSAVRLSGTWFIGIRK